MMQASASNGILPELLISLLLMVYLSLPVKESKGQLQTISVSMCTQTVTTEQSNPGKVSHQHCFALLS